MLSGNLNNFQIIVLSTYLLNMLIAFLYSLYKSKKINLGTVITTIVPSFIFLYLVENIKFDTHFNIIVYFLSVLLLLGGWILGKISFSYLGHINSDDFWLARKKEKKRYLVTKGPYKYVRHPLAISMLVSYFGLLLIFFHISTLFLYIVGFIIVVHTSIKEEKFMQNKFPEYKNYTKKTGRWLPKF